MRITLKDKNYSFLPRLIRLGSYPSSYYLPMTDTRGKMNMDVISYSLLLILAFLKYFIAFNKQISKFLICHNFNCRLVSDLYILFQSIQRVFITQKLGCNFRYQFRACDYNNFKQVLNFKWFISSSSFMYLNLLSGKKKAEIIVRRNQVNILVYRQDRKKKKKKKKKIGSGGR